MAEDLYQVLEEVVGTRTGDPHWALDGRYGDHAARPVIPSCSELRSLASPCSAHPLASWRTTHRSGAYRAAPFTESPSR